MSDVLLFSFRAIAPILLIVTLGYSFKLLYPENEKVYSAMNSLSYHLFLPIHLFLNIYKIESLGDVNWSFMGFIMGGVVVAFFLGLLFSCPFRARPGKRSVVLQAAFRSNQAVLGLPLALSIGSEKSVGFVSMATAFTVPALNIMSVVVMSYYKNKYAAGEAGTRRKGILLDCLKNPLVIASLAGLCVVFARTLLTRALGSLPFSLQDSLPSVYTAAENLAKVSSPLMLFVLGTKLNFKSLSKDFGPLAMSVALKLLIVPGAVIALAVLLAGPLQIQTFEMPALIAVFASSCAVGLPVLIQEMGGDDKLASQIVVWTTALSMLTIFLFVSVLRYFSFI